MRRFFGPTGSVSRIIVESRVLENNLFGDPSLRVVDIYLPAGHPDEGLPLLVDLVGFTAAGYRIRIGSASVRTCRNGSTG